MKASDFKMKGTCLPLGWTLVPLRLRLEWHLAKALWSWNRSFFFFRLFGRHMTPEINYVMAGRCSELPDG